MTDSQPKLIDPGFNPSGDPRITAVKQAAADVMEIVQKHMALVEIALRDLETSIRQQCPDPYPPLSNAGNNQLTVQYAMEMSYAAIQDARRNASGFNVKRGVLAAQQAAVLALAAGQIEEDDNGKF